MATHRKNTVYFMVILGACLALAGILIARSPSLLGGSEESRGDLLATVGATRITSVDLEEAIALRSREGEPNFATEEARAALLEQLIQRAVFAQAARDAALDETPEVVEAIERVLASQFEQKEMESRVASIEITRKDLEQAYLSRIDLFTAPERRRAAILKIEKPTTNSEEAYESRLQTAERARQAAVEHAHDSAGFGRVALDYSHHRASRYKGGDVGWFSERSGPGGYPVEVVDALFALPTVGSVSPVVESPSAFFVVRMMDHEPSVTRPLSEVEDRLRSDLRRERLQVAHGELVDQTYAAVGVSVVKGALASVRPAAISVDSPNAFEPPALPEL